MSSKRTKKGTRSLEGKVKRHPDGFGFFIPHDRKSDDLYISKEDMVGVFSNDSVRIIEKKQRGGGRPGFKRAEVVEILKRGSDRHIGRLKKDKEGHFYVSDSAYSWGMELPIEGEIAAVEGELVLVEIKSFPDKKGRGFKGRIVSSLGKDFNPSQDNMRVLYESSAPMEFSKKVLKEARALGSEVDEKDKVGRKDLRNLTFVTIDGVTAKDFDDAVFYERNGDRSRLIVAIADVSHYVRRGSALDASAYERGTSIYLSNFVCPMLPEEISNGLCSLNPNVDRLSFCCDMRINSDGEVQSFEFYEAVIKSHARVTYGEAQELIDGVGVPKLDHVAEMIRGSAQLATILNEKRMREGSIDFDIPGTKALVNDAGEPVDLIREERIFSNRLIEEFMLVTNICAARYLSKKNKAQLYRIHETPEKENTFALKKSLSSFLKIAPKPLATSHDFQKLSKEIESIDDSSLRQIASGIILRSMKQAKYSDEELGHFGLGFSHYSHFTSPIRRYPDLVIHRQIKSALGIPVSGYSDDEVSEMGPVLSAAEQRAVKAERRVTAIKKTRFLEKHLGEEFDGYVSSLARFGVFVSLKSIPIDGLVKVEELYPDHYIYDEETLTLRGRKTGLTIRLGDYVRVQVANVNVEDGKIDFTLLELQKNPKINDSSDREDFVASKLGGFERSSKPKRPRKGKGKGKGKSSKKSKKSGKMSFSSSSAARGMGFGRGKKK